MRELLTSKLSTQLTPAAAAPHVRPCALPRRECYNMVDSVMVGTIETPAPRWLENEAGGSVEFESLCDDCANKILKSEWPVRATGSGSLCQGDCDVQNVQ